MMPGSVMMQIMLRQFGRKLLEMGFLAVAWLVPSQTVSSMHISLFIEASVTQNYPLLERVQSPDRIQCWSID